MRNMFCNNFKSKYKELRIEHISALGNYWLVGEGEAVEGCEGCRRLAVVPTTGKSGAIQFRTTSRDHDGQQP